MFNSLWGFLSIAVICGSLPVMIAALNGKSPKDERRKFEELLDDMEDLQMEMEKKLDEREAATRHLEDRVRTLERMVIGNKS